MNLLITGGFGYLGTRLSDYFFKKGYGIRLLIHKYNKDLKSWSERFEIVKADITDMKSLKKCCNGIHRVIHLASLNETDSAKYPEKALKVTSYGTRNILEIASHANVSSLIYLSTFHVYGKERGFISEETTPSPTHDYSLTHLFGEYYCLQFSFLKKIPTTIIRFTNGYGSPVVKSINRWSLVLNDLCRMALSENRILLKSSGSQQRDFAWIDDLGQAIELIFKKPVEKVDGEIFNVGGECSLTIKTLAEVVSREFYKRFRKNLKIIKPKAKSKIEKNNIQGLEVDISKIKSFGFKPNDKIVEEIHRIFDLLQSDI